MKKLSLIFIAFVALLILLLPGAVLGGGECEQLFTPKMDQEEPSYPDYNTNPVSPDTTGMPHTAMEIADRIELGWNLGNSLEAIGGETAWGNPEVTEELIELVKKSGFNAIRLPCSWDQYADPQTAEISPDWMDRVEQVVQYCMDDSLYVILNIHWDGGWLENHCTPDRQDENNARQKAYWEQIATRFRDYDEHLLFAGTNEPNVEDAEQMEVLASYLQTFIDAVRSTGGRNAYRVLVIQGPSTDIEKTSKWMKQLPDDPVPDRLMAEIHYYTPWNFAGLTRDESWGKQFYYWGKDFHSTTDTERNATWGEEEAADRLLGLMQKQFVDHGIPVVLGEYAAVRRSRLTGDALKLHLASRAYYHQYITRQATWKGLIPFYWDNGGLNQGSGIFDRRALTVADRQTLNALIKGATE
jgi:aryl-phospho-beta-D-glucosidase BglC (GH1 family)